MVDGVESSGKVAQSQVNFVVKNYSQDSVEMLEAELAKSHPWLGWLRGNLTANGGQWCMMINEGAEDSIM